MDVTAPGWYALMLEHTQQKNVYCNTNGGGYIWVDPEQLAMMSGQVGSPLSAASFMMQIAEVHDGKS